MEQQLLALVPLNSVVVMVQMVDQQVEVLAHLPALLLLVRTVPDRTEGLLLLAVVRAVMVETLDSLQARAFQDPLQVVEVEVLKEAACQAIKMVAMAQTAA